ncbi:ABC transporter G family member 21-like [Nymphaea colorata]|nr:ABC transporter G family member 21-like [Nymphaea colorata]
MMAPEGRSEQEEHGSGVLLLPPSPSAAATADRPEGVCSTGDESGHYNPHPSSIDGMDSTITPPAATAARVQPRPDPQQQQPPAPLSVNGGRSLVFCQPLHPITLKFEDVGYKLKVSSGNGCSCFPGNYTKVQKTILEGMSGMVRPGEVMAMLGPSGSGKTTLLTALAGRLQQQEQGKVTGCITYNGQSFSGSVKRMTGYVSQDDVLYPHLTVSETLVFSALLRLPNSLSREVRMEQAETVLQELGLTKCRNSIIGGPLLRGVSGGERKRVSIGQEMLINPSLLLLDEPTSGMDSTTAQRIMSTLQRLARGGRTVVTTIHQPSSKLYHMFDRILLLCEGCCIYSGNTSEAMDYFSFLGFAPSVVMNPADFLLDLANGVLPDMNMTAAGLSAMEHLDHNAGSAIKQLLISSYKKNLAPALRDDLHNSYVCDQHLSSATTVNKQSLRGGWSTSWWEQFSVLLTRSMKERRHESFSGLRIFQVLSVSVLCGLMWWHSKVSNVQDQVGLLFFFSIFWGFFPMFNAVFTFPQERPMLVKERHSRMYRLSAYFLARTVGDLPMELVLPSLFVTITYWMGGLRPTVPAFLLTLLVMLYNVLVSQGVGLALGAVLMDTKQGATLASVLMMAFLLAGGYYVQHVPPFVSWLKYFSYSYYCYKLLLGVQYSEDDTYLCGWSPSKGSILCRVADYPAVKHMGLDHKGLDVAALTAMLLGYRLIAYAALRMGRVGRC